MQALLGGFFVLIAAIAWSTAGLFTRVVSTDIPTTLFGRSIAGGICVLAIYALFQARNNTAVWRFSMGEFVIAILSAAGMMCFISAFFFTTIANVSFLYGLMPLVTLLLSAIILHQRPTSLGIFCCVLAAIGVAAIMWNQKNLTDWFGILLAFGMTFFMSALTVATKFYPNADVTKATYLSAFLAALITLPFSTFQDASTSDVLWLGLYGIVNVGLGFGVYLLGVSRVTALAAALIGLAEIPLAPIWAAILFDERAGGLAIAGGALVFVSAIVFIWFSRKVPDETHVAVAEPTPR